MLSDSTASASSYDGPRCRYSIVSENENEDDKDGFDGGSPFSIFYERRRSVSVSC